MRLTVCRDCLPGLSVSLTFFSPFLCWTRQGHVVSLSLCRSLALSRTPEPRRIRHRHRRRLRLRLRPTTTSMPRLVRRAPLAERIKAAMDPSDWLMRIGEDVNSSDWEEFAQSYALYIGFGVNMAFIVAQANNGSSSQFDGDGVFREASGPGWLKWMMNLLVTVLAGMSFMNAWLAFGKKRHYRLFEQPIERTPATPSAQRVRVDSSPASASPLSYFRNVVSRNSAAARAHPDASRDVWEIAVWDPNPLALELFCLFSPLHVMLYYFNLPVAPLDPRPSVRVTTTIFIGALLSLHLWWLRSAFTQQIKDNAIISREVLHEYDSKFVHPALQKQGRDVGIQTISKKGSRDSSVGVKGSSRDLASEIVTYTPTTVIKRAFRTKPNPNYVSQYDPDGLRSTQHTPSVPRSARYTSTATEMGADADGDNDMSSPIRPAYTPNPFRTAPTMPRTGDGGSLGVYTHAASPLRKSSNLRYRDENPIKSRDTLTGFADNKSISGPGERRHHPSPTKREGSPLKRMSISSGDQTDRLGRVGGYTGLGLGRRESGRM